MAKKAANQKSMAPSVPEALDPRRRAAIACVEAMREICAAAVAAGSDKQADIRPHVSCLYQSLRDGWEPISHCWPCLAEAEQHQERLMIRDPEGGSMYAKFSLLSPSLTAWTQAKQVFWMAVVNTPHHESALKAWCKWLEKYVPATTDGQESSCGDQDTWACLRQFGEDHRSSWTDRISQIIEETHLPSEPFLSESGPEPRPFGLASREPPKTLPNSQAELNRLRERLDDFLDMCEIALKEEGIPFIWDMAAFQRRSIAPSSWRGSRKGGPNLREVLPHLRELGSYLDPIVLQCRWFSFFVWLQWYPVPGLQKNRTTAGITSWELPQDEASINQIVGKLLRPYQNLRCQVLTKLDKAAEGVVLKPATKRGKQGEKAHTAPPPPDDNKWHGPIEGQLKFFVENLGMERKTLWKRQEAGAIWIMKIHSKKYRVWFSTNGEYFKCKKFSPEKGQKG